jgi:Mg-chelatase subunit ChlD
MRSLLAIFVAALLLAALPALAQQTGRPLYKIDQEPVETYTTDDAGKAVRYVKMKFTVTRQGEPADDVGKNYKILIEENNHRVKVEDVPRPTVSDDLGVVLAMDISGSMSSKDRMAQAKHAADVFLGALPRKADCGLILFDHEIRVKEPPTTDRGTLRQHIQAARPMGGTAYLDAALEAIEMLRGSRHPDKALVLMTDGIDLNSKATLDQVIQRAKEAKVRVYPIGIGEPGKLEPLTTVLALDKSGSMTVPASDEDKLPKIDALKVAARRFADYIRPNALTTVLEFSDTTGVPEPFTGNKNVVKLFIQNLSAKGETALFDATYTAIATLEAEGRPGKWAVVALTDGIDNTSRRRVEEVIQRAQQAKNAGNPKGIPLYMLGFGRPGEIDEKVMKDMADKTGGRFFHAKDQKSLMAIFEQLSNDLNDDGIDEASLTRLAAETKGQYYPAKDVSQLRFILERVTKNIQQKKYEVTFPSLFQTGDGTGRGVTLKLVRLSGELAGGTDPAGAPLEVLERSEGSYQVRGVVVPEMNPFIYLFLLAVLGVLLALPASVRRLSRSSGRS